MIKALIFDWGGVLEFVNMNDFFKEIYTTYGTGRKLFIEHELAARLKMDMGEITTDQFIAAINRILDKKITFKEFYNIFTKHVTMNDDLFALLRKLKTKYRLFILSNNNPIMLKYMKENTDAEEIFDKVIISFQVKMKKPNPQIFLKVLEGTGIKPEECIFIDDREDLVDKAKNLGMQGIVYTDFESFLKSLKSLGIKPE